MGKLSGFFGTIFDGFGGRSGDATLIAIFCGLFRSQKSAKLLLERKYKFNITLIKLKLKISLKV